MQSENPTLAEEDLSTDELRARAEIELLKVRQEAKKADRMMAEMIREVHAESDKRNREIEAAHRTGPHKETRKMLHKWMLNMQDIEGARATLAGFPMLKPPISPSSRRGKRGKSKS